MSKNKIREFFKELSAGFFIACLAVLCFLIGIAFFPRFLLILPMEIIGIIGFFIILCFLFIVNTLSRLFKKRNKE